MNTDGVRKSTHKVFKQKHLENVKNTPIKAKELQRYAKNTRTKLRDLQSSAENKENLVGRLIIDKDVKFACDYDKVERRTNVAQKSVQTGEGVITAEDLMSDEPSLDYWKRLAETTQDALDKSLQENDELQEQYENLMETTKCLQEENSICKEMLEESKHLVAVLQEILEEGESDMNTSQNEASRTELAEEATED